MTCEFSSHGRDVFEQTIGSEDVQKRQRITQTLQEIADLLNERQTIHLTATNRFEYVRRNVIVPAKQFMIVSSDTQVSS